MAHTFQLERTCPAQLVPHTSTKRTMQTPRSSMAFGLQKSTALIKAQSNLPAGQRQRLTISPSAMGDMHGELSSKVLVIHRLEFVCIKRSPGRFLAASELKTMMAHILMNYDVKLEQEGVRPPNMHLAHNRLPNRKAKVLFRKRAV